jgi:hypothetical protein
MNQSALPEETRDVSISLGLFNDIERMAAAASQPFDAALASVIKQGLRAGDDPAQGSVVVPLSTLDPDAQYRITQEVPVVIEPSEEEFIATFFDANISTSGDTPVEAFDNLRSLIVRE